MSFSLRSLSGRRYRVEGDLPSIGSAEFSKALLDRRFAPLSPHEERAFGWVTADNCLDSRFEAGSVARGPCAVFSLRIDKRRVNSRLLKAMMDLELRGRRKDAEQDSSLSALTPPEGAGAGASRSVRRSRDEKQELRRAVTEELMRNTNPTMEVHPVLLYPKEKLLVFGALSKAANETFRALFTDTFDASLSALTPYHRALELLVSKGGGEALAGLRRTDFARSGSPAGAPAAPGNRIAADPSAAARSAVAAVSSKSAVEELRR